MFLRSSIFFLYAFLVVGKPCYWNSKCNYAYFGSKTVYDDVRGDLRDVPEVKDCKVVGVWTLVRHGTRQPSSFNVVNMRHAAQLKEAIVVRNLFENHGEMCAQDITNLQNWSWNDTIDYSPGYLTTEGYREMYELGARFHKKFLTLLQDLDHYQFRPTLEQRTTKSAGAFIEGLSQGYWMFHNSNATDRDEVLRPYFYCTRHNVEVYNGKRPNDELNNYYETKEFQEAKNRQRINGSSKIKRHNVHYAWPLVKHHRHPRHPRQSRLRKRYITKREMKKYLTTHEYIEMLHHVQNRAGLNQNLTYANVTGLYDLCRFGRASSASRTSPWCALFTDQDLIILEYLNDIRHYYRNGYGSSINAKLAGPALKDLFENFQSVVSAATTGFTGYFTHDSLLQMVYTALGLFRDYPGITGFERVEGRKWRTSFMTPFAGNFIAVLHKCSKTNGTDQHQVQFFINEEEFHLCSARTCSWEQFRDKLSPFLNTNLEICNLNYEYTSTTRPSETRK